MIKNRILVTPKMSNVGIVFRWVISLVIAKNLEQIPVESVILANLLVSSPRYITCVDRQITCPVIAPRLVREVKNATLNTIPFLVLYVFFLVALIVGNHVTSNAPLPTWEPINPEPAAEGCQWGGADAPGW